MDGRMVVYITYLYGNRLIDELGTLGTYFVDMVACFLYLFIYLLIYLPIQFAHQLIIYSITNNYTPSSLGTVQYLIRDLKQNRILERRKGKTNSPTSGPRPILSCTLPKDRGLSSWIVQ